MYEHVVHNRITSFRRGAKPCQLASGRISRPSGGAPPNWPWNNNCWPSANPSGTTRRQLRPSCADASSATSRACPVLDTGNSSSSWPNRTCRRQQRRRTQPATSGHQPQGQRRHPLGAGHRAQDGAGIPLRRLARPKSKSSRRLPSAARFPSTLNCYDHPAGHRGLRCPGRHLHRGWQEAVQPAGVDRQRPGAVTPAVHRRSHRQGAVRKGRPYAHQ